MTQSQQPAHPERKIRFDGTINAGHVLTFIGMLFMLFVGWTALDKRVVVLETQREAQRDTDKKQDEKVIEQYGAIKESIAEVKRSLDALRDQKK